MAARRRTEDRLISSPAFLEVFVATGIFARSMPRRLRALIGLAADLGGGIAALLEATLVEVAPTHEGARGSVIAILAGLPALPRARRGGAAACKPGRVSGTTAETSAPPSRRSGRLRDIGSATAGASSSRSSLNGREVGSRRGYGPWCGPGSRTRSTRGRRARRSRRRFGTGRLTGRWRRGDRPQPGAERATLGRHQ